MMCGNFFTGKCLYLTDHYCKARQMLMNMIDVYIPRYLSKRSWPSVLGQTRSIACIRKH